MDPPLDARRAARVHPRHRGSAERRMLDRGVAAALAGGRRPRAAQPGSRRHLKARYHNPKKVQVLHAVGLGDMSDDLELVIAGIRRLRIDIEAGIREGEQSRLTTAGILNRLRALQAQAVELQRPAAVVGTMPSGMSN